MKLFYSYCHSDESHRTRLEKFLVNLRDSGKITEWHDRKIHPGDDWNAEIQKNMEDADILLLLISQDYLYSSACKNELNYALNNYLRQTIIPIILSPCTWQSTECSRIQALPTDAKPIVSWDTRDEAWMSVIKGIESVVERKRLLCQKKEYLSKLEKVGFVSSAKQNIKLSELFVWPDFRLYNVDGVEKKVTGCKDLFLNKDERFSIIRGKEQSGKSSIVNILCLEASTNYMPLQLDGDLIHKTIDFDALASVAFSSQYNGDYTEYLKSNNRILIIDNYNHKISPNIIIWAKTLFDFIVLVIPDEEYMLYFKDDGNYADFNIFNIRSFGKQKTYDLIMKWKNLDQACCPGTEVYDRVIDDIENKLQGIIQENHVVPSYPFYILSIIQAFEGFMPSDYQITTYGHCYYALIVSQLIKKSISHNDLGDCINYLTHVAYEIFKVKDNGNRTISIDQYNDIKKEYKDKFIIKDALIARIEDSEYPIIRINSHVSFEYPYIYYFFIGKYLAENVEIKTIQRLCETIYLKEAANILIFTIHHTTNTLLLNEIQLYCMMAFEKKETAKLTKEETVFMDSLIYEMPKQILSKKPVEENRKQERLIEDQRREHLTEDNDNIKDDDSDELLEIEKAQKIIEVLGQILKNRAGTFDKQRVSELLNEVEELGFRLLSFYLNTLKDPDFYNWMEARLKAVEQDKRKLSDEAIKAYIEKNIQIMGMVIIMGVLHKLFSSICTDKLIDLQRSLSNSNPTPAYEFIDLLFQITYKGIDYEDIKKMNKKYAIEKNNWATKTLSFMLQHYLNTHNVNFRVRQQICSLLQIEYKPNTL